MGQLNLYRIDAHKHEEFKTAIEDKFIHVGTLQTIKRMVDSQEKQFELSFFIDLRGNENLVEWNWLLTFFGNNDVTSRSNPRGVLVIKVYDEIFAFTYGFSYFVVDKYCDTDFAFDFARRVKYKEVKTLTLLSPSSRRNKVVNTYLNYNNLEFDSGESFAKLKVKADLPEDFELFKPTIEVGHSIKFEGVHDTIEAVIDTLIHVKSVLKRSEIYKIPVFNKVSDKSMIEQLNNRLADNLEKNPLLINLSELDIIGVREIFNCNDSSFEIWYNRKHETLSHLASEDITIFIQSNGLTLYEGDRKSVV